ncbi:hemicentin-2-like, partial [Mizuhopecten yessoensis]|uniref:hemicentin-2-like n=1 Tax=Mizuhopecten yessoensis TaxID=6573 RepID=UPI000B4581D9
GPGTVTLSPSAIYYTKTEGDTLPDITCTAECRPDCTFVWTKPDNSNFTASDVLSLGQLDRSEHGTYICTARNVAGELTTRVFVSVMYGPSAAGLSPPATSYTLTERQTISTVTCSSDCYPVCTYRWTKNGQSHTTGSGLHLNNIQRGQTGEYRCTASNEYGSQTSSEVTVIVNYGPDTVTLSPPDTTYTRTEGDTFQDITCTADCRPGCTFVWTKPDNTNFTASAVLSLEQLDRSEHGPYRCTAGNVIGTSMTTTTVTVQYGPGDSITFEPMQDVAERVENQTVPNIKCFVDCRPPCMYSWSKSGKVRPNPLSLSKVTRNNAGIYTCTAHNTISRGTKSWQLIVNYGPGTVTLFPAATTYIRTEGNTLPDITCKAECRPDCTFVWTKPDNTNFTASAVLSLEHLDRSEQGSYRCTAGNAVGASMTTTTVTVQFPPAIDSLGYNQGDADVMEHGSKTLICKVESVPSSTITWYYKNNDTQLLTITDVLESSFTLTSAGCFDTGLYTCSARNSVSNTSVTKDIRINVLCSPRLDPRVFTVRKLGLATHDHLTMNAMFLSNPKPSSFTWTFQNSSHTSFTELNNGTDNFVIHNTHFTSNLSALSVGTRANIQEAWFGLYNVTATNSEGNGTLTFTVAAKGKPNPPYEGRAVCPNTDRVILSWRSAFNGGADQTFAVGRRESEKDNFVIEQTLEKLQDPGQHRIINITVSDLTPGTQHFFTVYAVNVFGNSTFIKDVSCATKVAESSSENSLLIAILGGVGGSVVAIIVLAVIVVIIITKRRSSGKHTRDEDTEMVPRDRRSAEDDSKDGMKPNILYESSDGLQNNILYESGEAQPGTSSDYAVVQKPSKGKPGSPDAVDAVVNKPKTEQLQNVNDVYAEVKKPKTKLGKGKQKEGVKKQTVGLQNNILYESGEAQPGTSSDYAVVQKPSKGKPGSPDAVDAVVNKPKTEQLQNVNDVYAEVKKPKTKLGKGKQKEGVKKQTVGLQNNILYESVDAQPGTSSEYAVVQKPSKGKPGSPDAVDAVVNKPKTEQLENVNDVYAEVKKPKNKLGKGKQKEGEKKQTEFEFKDDNQNGRNFIIHGIENKTDYADVDFTKHAPPLPPDNEEEQQPAETKND